jgi:benzoyl-CoA-dihydrodiol lyase
MLGVSSHAWKVNFCKFTNETRNGIEDTSKHSGLKFIAAVNGACAGGGYELALACDEIILVDDRSSSVSLPEVPLLGVLPGTGGLTRVTDKRRVRHDLADIFCTSVEGVRGQRAVDWRLVDAIAKPAQFGAVVQERAAKLAEGSDRPAGGKGVSLTRLQREDGADSLRYEHVTVEIDRTRRTATLTVKAPTGAQPADIAAIEAAGAAWWPLAMARQLDDAILNLRTNELDIGTWLLKTEGDAQAVLASDATLVANKDHWLVRETIGALRRTLARLDVSSRSLFALVEEGSCFAGTLAELAFAADRAYMLALPDAPEKAPKLSLNELNFGFFPMVNDQSRLQRRFYEESAPLEGARGAAGKALDADEALKLGLVTAAPDDIDWNDEIRMAIEERAAMSPDALTGLEANLRFASKENMNTRIFGRLTAWQNWIFNRPNAVGPKGALKVYGSGEKAGFDLNRV